MPTVRTPSFNRITFLMIGAMQIFLGITRYITNQAEEFALQSHGMEFLHLGMGLVFLGLGMLYWLKFDLTISSGVLEEHKVLKIPLSSISGASQSWTGKITFTMNNGLQHATMGFYTKRGLRKILRACAMKTGDGDSQVASS